MKKFISSEVDDFEPRGHSRGSLYLISKRRVRISKLQLFTLGIDRPENVDLKTFIESVNIIMRVYYKIHPAFAVNQYSIMKDEKPEKENIHRYLQTYSAELEIFEDYEHPVSKAHVTIENIDLNPGEVLEILADEKITHWWFRDNPREKHSVFDFFVDTTLENPYEKSMFRRCLPLSTIDYEFN